MNTITDLIDKGWTLKKTFSHLRKKYPYHGDSVILFEILNTAKRIEKPVKQKDLNICIKKQIEDKLDDQTKENLLKLTI